MDLVAHASGDHHFENQSEGLGHLASQHWLPVLIIVLCLAVAAFLVYRQTKVQESKTKDKE